jgi:hypothetical protein
MLVMHNVISMDGAWEGTASCPAFESMDEAIMWCERHFKEVCSHSATSITAQDVLGRTSRTVLSSRSAPVSFCCLAVWLVISFPSCTFQLCQYNGTG